MEQEGKSRGGQSPSPTPLGIFWDLKSCPIPDGLNPADVPKNIREALSDHVPDYNLEAFFAYGDPSDFPSHPLPMWEHDITKVHVVGGRYCLFMQMFGQAMGLVVNSLPWRAVIVFISGEKQNEALLVGLQQYGYRVVFVIPSNDPVAGYFCNWPRLILLDWLSVARGSGKIIPKGYQPSIAARAAGDEDAVEG